MEYLPAAPFLVVITTAPEAARKPYKAAAAGPLSTVMFAISSGLISIARLEPGADWATRLVPCDTCVLLSTGIPSMIYKGWLLPLKDVPPRISMIEEAPGAPPELVIVTPATFPCNAFTMLD